MPQGRQRIEFEGLLQQNVIHLGDQLEAKLEASNRAKSHNRYHGSSGGPYEAQIKTQGARVQDRYGNTMHFTAER